MDCRLVLWTRDLCPLSFLGLRRLIFSESKRKPIVALRLPHGPCSRMLTRAAAIDAALICGRFLPDAGTTPHVRTDRGQSTIHYQRLTSHKTCVITCQKQRRSSDVLSFSMLWPGLKGVHCFCRLFRIALICQPSQNSPGADGVDANS